MSNPIFPALTQPDWQATRDTMKVYAQLLGKIRRALTPHQKHWWHVSLRAAATGLTTTPIPAGEQVIELLLDFNQHQLLITSSKGTRQTIALTGQSAKVFYDQVLEQLQTMGVEVKIDQSLFADENQGKYDATAVAQLWQAFSQIDATFKEFRHSFRGESSPVQLWPHHFDLAVLWFSGRLVPDQDPKNEEYADEQMNFGFSTGDSGIPAPYFYITAYPAPAGFSNHVLPQGAYWQTTGWTGAVLPYATLSQSDNPRDQLLDFLNTVHKIGLKTM